VLRLKEFCWLFGITAHAAAATLTAFLLGLAAGGSSRGRQWLFEAAYAGVRLILSSRARNGSM
jgi:hypothetical protein